MVTIQREVDDTSRTASIQTYARIAGVLLLVSLVAGGFGEAYAPSTLIVSGNATATAHNIMVSDVLFRLGFLGYLIEAACDVTLTFLLYVLLQPVHARLALLAVLFRIMATATFAFAELFYFAPSLILGGAGYLQTFSINQLHTLALLSLTVYGFASSFSSLFYGIGSLLLGYLLVRSGYLPRSLGVLWMIGGIGFVAGIVVLVLAPTYASPLLQVPTVLGLLFLAIWLLIRGVDVDKWSERIQLPVSP